MCPTFKITLRFADGDCVRFNVTDFVLTSFPSYRYRLRSKCILAVTMMPKRSRRKVNVLSKPAEVTESNGHSGCLPFVTINRLGRPLNNGEGSSKISKPTERNGAYHLQFDVTPVIVFG